MNQEFQFALKQELAPDEQVIWSGHPDANSMSAALLPFSILWLSGLFLFSAGLLQQARGDTTQLLNGLTFLLVLVATICTVELIFVPRRAVRTIYVITNRRVLSICVTKKMGPRQPEDELPGKNLIRQSEISAPLFYASNLPAVLLLCMVACDVFARLQAHFDFFSRPAFF